MNLSYRSPALPRQPDREMSPMAGKNPVRQTLGCHVVRAETDGTTLLYVDRHLVHEVTSPQASRVCVWPVANLAGQFDIGRAGSQRATTARSAGVTGIADPISRVASPDARCQLCRVRHYRICDERSASGHRACDRPEQGATLPGMTVVCGDSHTSTHGRLARWHSASVPLKSSMCWRRNV